MSAKDIERLADVVHATTMGRVYTPEEVVRAILQALREPSEEMLRPAIFQGDIGDSGLDRGEVRFVWKAMIDHLLAD